MAALVVAFVGVGAAIFVPLWIEYKKRPRLSIETAADANHPSGEWRIVHVRVVNPPIRGRFGRALLRNLATGCTVQISFRSMSDGSGPLPIRGSWSARPEPLQDLIVTDARGVPSLQVVYDQQKQGARWTYDVSPGDAGEGIAVAIKHDGDDAAYAFADELLYQSPSGLRHPAVELPHTEYEVTVRAQAGEIVAEQSFRLHNQGSRYTGLGLAK